MQHPEYKDLVGYLVGSIMRQAPCLIIAIYALPDGRHSTTVTSGVMFRTPRDEVERLAETFKPALHSVWANDRTPHWLYIQLDALHPPGTLRNWDLPRQLYGAWSEQEGGP